MQEINLDSFWELQTDNFTIKYFSKSERERVISEFMAGVQCPRTVAETVVDGTFKEHGIEYEK